ncbi:sugar ABC transporter permease [Pelagibius sp. CAU 1746]|uniref:carbohydrate ABC transporter permease n=1 Tax=Pelagibius sp. CAU 1746 TaxID=3140370 RepID=UPI00325B08DE
MSLRLRLILPLALLLAGIMIYPLAFSGWISLHDYRLTRIDDVRFEGSGNYEFILSDGSFWNALSNTFVFVGGAVTLELVIGLGLALLLQKLVRFQNVARAILLAPMFITPIAVGLMFRFLLNSELGVIPHYLAALGITVDWFGPDLALFSIILIDVWQWTPFMVLMLLAGLEALPRSPFEAARVDGASAWLTFRKLTLPMLQPVIVVAVIIRALDAFKVFEYVYAITRGGPGDATETIQFLIYKTGFRFFRLGEAASMAFVLVTITLALVVALYMSTRRR